MTRNLEELRARARRALERVIARPTGAVDEDPADAETIERLEHGLRRMSRRQREIFLAIRLDDTSYAEIAERTGLGADRVERHFAEALVILSDALAGTGERSRCWRFWHWVKRWEP